MYVCMSETESGIGLIDTVSVHLSVIKKETPCATTDIVFLENPKETYVTFTQRKINILKQEIVSRKTYPGWSQHSSVVRGKERTSSVFLGLHRILLI